MRRYGVFAVMARPWPLALCVLVLVGIPAGAVSVVQAQSSVARLEEQAMARSADSARSIAALIEQRIAAIRDSITTTTGDPDMRHAMAARDAVRVAGLLHRARGVMGPDVGSLSAVDVDGHYLSGSPFHPEFIAKFPATDWLIGASFAAGPLIAAGASVGIADASSIMIAAPVHAYDDATPAGTVLATVDLHRVATWLSPVLSAVDDAYLIDAQGRLIARATERGRTRSVVIADAPLVRALLDGRPAPEHAVDPISGAAAISGSGAVPAIGWHVLTVTSSERIGRQIAPLAASSLSTTATLVLLLIGAALLLGHTAGRALHALQHEALTDPLTGLANRRAMHEHLALFDALARRSGRGYSLVAFDLDGLKQINDRFGHDAGDQVIRTFGRLLRENLRDSDIAVRLGGDEFVAILSDATMTDATHAFERIRAAAKDLRTDARSDVTLSAGAVAWRTGRAPEELVQAADAMLYEAKRAGRDRVVTEASAA